MPPKLKPPHPPPPTPLGLKFRNLNEIMLIMRKREPHYFDRLMWDPTPFRGLVVKDSQGGQDKQGHDSAMAGAHGEQHAELYEDEDEDKVLP